MSLKNLFKNGKQDTTEKVQEETFKSELPNGYSIKKYILMEPRKLLADYRMWNMCKQIPMAIEDNDKNGWNTSILLPNNIIMRAYFDNLNFAPEDFRTIYIVTGSEPKVQTYLLPGGIIPSVEYSKDVLNRIGCPEINKTIVKIAKFQEQSLTNYEKTTSQKEVLQKYLNYVR